MFPHVIVNVTDFDKWGFGGLRGTPSESTFTNKPCRDPVRYPLYLDTVVPFSPPERLFFIRKIRDHVHEKRLDTLEMFDAQIERDDSVFAA